MNILYIYNMITTLGTLQISISFAVLLHIAVIGLIVLTSKIWKKNELPNEDESVEEDFYGPYETVTSQNYQKQVFFLKRIAQQISEDRKEIVNSVLKDQTDLQEQIFEKLESIQPFNDETFTSLKQKFSAQDVQAEFIMKNLDTLGKEFSSLKSQLQHELFCHVKPDNPASMKSSFPAPAFQNQCQEISDLESLSNVLSSARESFKTLTADNRSKGRQMIENISRFLEQNQDIQKDIQKEIAVFSSVASGSGNADGKNVNLTLIDEVEKIIKNLLETFIFLNRQRFDMENLQKTLVYFNNRFVYSANKFDLYLQQNKACHTSASKHLERAEIVWNSAKTKLSTSSDILSCQSDILTKMLEDVKTAQNRVRLLSDFNRAKEHSSFELASKTHIASWVENIDILNKKLEKILYAADNSKETLNSVTQTSNNLDKFHNVINSVLESYNNLLCFLSNRTHLPNETKCKAIEACCRTNNERRMVQMSDNSGIDDRVWDDTSELENSCIASFVPKHFSGQTNEKDQWGNFPSECLLSDVSSDILIQNSDESDKVSDESL